MPRDASGREPRHRRSRSSASARRPTSSRSSRAHTELRRRGARYLGLCPFHDERTPVVLGRPVEKLYYCFGCQAGGDVFTLPPGEGGARLPRGGRAARRPLRRRARASTPRDPGEDERRRERERLLRAAGEDRRASTPATCGTRTRRRGARDLSRGPRPRPRGARGVRRRLRARAPGTGC